MPRASKNPIVQLGLGSTRCPRGESEASASPFFPSARSSSLAGAATSCAGAAAALAAARSDASEAAARADTAAKEGDALRSKLEALEADAATAAELGCSVDAEAAAAEHGRRGSGSLVCDESGLPLDLPAEFLIGVQECDTHDPVDRMVAFPKSLELVHDFGARMRSLAAQRDKAAAAAEHGAAARASRLIPNSAQQASAEAATAAAAALATQRAAHSAALVDLRTMAQSMGNDVQRHLEEALASSRMENATASAPRTLRVKSGKPVNAFEPQARPAAFMSSKPAEGINHKEFGVTSEGVAVFVERALRELGVDARADASVRVCT